MKKIQVSPRPNWREHAEEHGFDFHTSGGGYWNEAECYSFTLKQIEDDLEDPSAELHQMFMSGVDAVLSDERLLSRFGIPDQFYDYVRRSWLEDKDHYLYGRFDLAYDGTGPAKLLEYNANTPTSLYEASAYQWIWLEEQQERGEISQNFSQFNNIYEDLVERFKYLYGHGSQVHFTSFDKETAPDDYATTEYLGWAAHEAGVVPHWVHTQDIGVSDEGYFADDQQRIMRDLFTLYPWEDFFRDDFGGMIPDSHCRFIEPAWKALTTKAMLPILWEMFPGHPNLLPAYFEADVLGGKKAVGLESGVVRKPIFSREGASVEILVNDKKIAGSEDQAFEEHPTILQAYHKLPQFGEYHPIIGTWMVGDKCSGMAVREDKSIITQFTGLITPHFIAD
ncbi:glutathionylspermidine synthase family protein [Sulfitobacter sp. R18_1]|uniref:glutathionylspermidine synthase family protein n=1 Tax=Sulfitobacter sp. R18_1 TaxID=2821104 RepID=UPI001AD9618A|nr:glutathionylspermidine synthase family protein [Sulfitobacter sp. R18_1]